MSLGSRPGSRYDQYLGCSNEAEVMSRKPSRRINENNPEKQVIEKKVLSNRKESSDRIKSDLRVNEGNSNDRQMEYFN